MLPPYEGPELIVLTFRRMENVHLTQEYATHTPTTPVDPVPLHSWNLVFQAYDFSVHRGN